MLHHIIEKANRSMQPASGARADQALRRSAKTHALILDLIKAGDADKAAALWNRHLHKAEEYVLAGSELSTVLDLLD